MLKIFFGVDIYLITSNMCCLVRFLWCIFVQVLEKMRPIDKKLKYQVDKVIQLAVTGGAGIIYSLIYLTIYFTLFGLFDPPLRSGEGIIGIHFVRLSVCPSVTFCVCSMTYVRINGLLSNLVQMLSSFRRCTVTLTRIHTSKVKVTIDI